MRDSGRGSAMSMSSNNRLLSDVRFVRLSLDESSSGNGKLRVKGEFAKCGIATENKRVYPEAVWNKEIGRLNKAIGDRRVFGEMDHPADGRTSLNRVSHIVTGLSVSKDGLIIGEAEVLPTEAGKNLSALLASGCKVGVSSRGYGSTKPNPKGEEVVQDDYKLVTFDFVAEPADVDAYPGVQESAGSETKKLVFEGVALDEASAAQVKDEQEKAAQFAKKIEAESAGKVTNADVREEFAMNILDTIRSTKAQAKEEARQDFLNDPKVAAAVKLVDQLKVLVGPFFHEGEVKTALESKDTQLEALRLQLAEQELKVKGLEADNAKLVGIAKEAGYKYWFERTLTADPDVARIRTAVGDVKAYENLEALTAKVTELRKGFEAERDAARKIAEEKAAAEAAQQKLVADAKASAEAKSEQLKEALEKALQSEKAIALQLYAERKLTNHPQASKLRSLLESSSLSSTSDIDEMLNSFREPARDPDEMESLRARVRRQVGGGVEDAETEINEEVRPRREVRDYNGLGANVGELKKLSGIHSSR